MTVRDLLSDETTWCKGAPLMGGEKHCLITAIHKCYVGKKADKIIKKVRATGLIPKGMLIPEWNDAPERTFADIRRVIEEAGI